MYTTEWKKPAPMGQETPTRNSAAPASSPKKWWKNMSAQQLHEAKGKEAGQNILASLQGGHRQEKWAGTSKNTADWSQPGASDICALKHSHKKWQTQWVDTEAEFDLNDGSQNWWWAGCGPSGDWSTSDIKRTQKQWQNSWAESGAESSKRGARRSLGGSSSTWSKNDRSETKASRKSLNGRDEATWEPRLRRASESPKKARRPSVSTSPQKPRRGSVAVTPASSTQNQSQTPTSRSRRATIACAQPARENISMDTPKSILSSTPLSENGRKLRMSIGAEDGCSAGASDATNRQLFMTEDETSDVEEPITNIGEERAKELPKTSRTRSYCTWLNARQPLWRFDPVGEGWAWDGPQSKAEKRELLHLSLFAENEVLKNDNYSLNSERAVLFDEVEFLRAELEKFADQDAPAPR